MRKFRVHMETLYGTFRGFKEVHAWSVGLAQKRAEWLLRSETSDPISLIRVVDITNEVHK